MPYEHRKSLSVITPTGTQNAGQRTYSAEKLVEISVAVADAATDFQVDVALDVNQAISVYIASDQDVTLEVNDGAGSGGTINLVANKAYDWDTDAYDSLLLAVDVTAFFFTNSSGSTANIIISLLEDATD